MKLLKNQIPPLSKSDISAILIALPLVNLGFSDDPAQITRNHFAVECSIEKLLNKRNQYSAEELRVIFVAIGFALDFLSGINDDLFDKSSIDPEWRKSLSQNLFIYNRLYPLFDRLILQIEARL